MLIYGNHNMPVNLKLDILERAFSIFGDCTLQVLLQLLPRGKQLLLAAQEALIHNVTRKRKRASCFKQQLVMSVHSNMVRSRSRPSRYPTIRRAIGVIDSKPIHPPTLPYFFPLLGPSSFSFLLAFFTWSFIACCS